MSAAERFLERLANVHRNGAGWTACCPAHEDRRPSLSIKEGDDGRVLVTCHAGCTFEEIVGAVELGQGARPSTRTTGPKSGRRGAQAVAVYNDVDDAGRPLFDVCRTADKQFPNDPG